MVILPPSIRDELARQVAACSDPTDPDALPFTNTDGGQVRANNWRKRVFYPACQRAGIDPIPHVHDLRHSAASIAFAAGATPKEVQEMLGHADPRLTLAIYTDVLAGLQEATADRLDAMIAAADPASGKAIPLAR